MVPENLQNKIDAMNEAWKKMESHEQEECEIDFVARFTHHSTALGGNALTEDEIRKILIEHVVPKAMPLRELDDIRGHEAAWRLVRRAAEKKKPLSENLIKDIHQAAIPMPGVGGIYRTVPLSVRGARHVPPSPDKVRAKMKYLIADYGYREFGSSIEKAAWLHAQFYKIHPFVEGSGRTARLLLNYQLMLDGMPPTFVKKDNAQRYYKALDTYAEEDNLRPFCDLVKETLEQEIDEFMSHLK